MISRADQVIDWTGGTIPFANRMSKIMGRRVPASTVATWKKNQEFPYPWDRIVSWHANELGLPTEPLPDCLRPPVEW